MGWFGWETEKTKRKYNKRQGNHGVVGRQRKQRGSKIRDRGTLGWLGNRENKEEV